MLSSIFDRRIKTEDGYDLYLEIPEKEYLAIYEDVNDNAAGEIVRQYLNWYQDDGRPESVKINHDRKNHTVNIRVALSYLGNHHTDPMLTPNHLRHYEGKTEH